MKKYKFLILTSVLLLAITMIGFAATAVTKIDAASASDISLTVDQKVWKPMETDGSPIYPVIIKGRTYLPLRALLDKFGIGVFYDEKTKTIQLTSKEIDKASPKLGIIEMDPKPDKSMSIEYNRAELEALGRPKLTQENKFVMSEKSEIWVNGVLSKVSVQDISMTKYENVSVAKVEVDKATGEITKLELVTDTATAAGTSTGASSDTGAGSDAALRVTITIIISRPPLVITVIIKF